jgi:hypothetical protein
VTLLKSCYVCCNAEDTEFLFGTGGCANHCFKMAVYPTRKPSDEAINQFLYDGAVAAYNDALKEKENNPLAFKSMDITGKLNPKSFGDMRLKKYSHQALQKALKTKGIKMHRIVHQEDAAEIYGTMTTRSKSVKAVGHLIYGSLNYTFKNDLFPGFEYDPSQADHNHHVIFIDAKNRLNCMNLVDSKSKPMKLPVQKILKIKKSKSGFKVAPEGYLSSISSIYKLTKKIEM